MWTNIMMDGPIRNTEQQLDHFIILSPEHRRRCSIMRDKKNSIKVDGWNQSHKRQKGRPKKSQKMTPHLQEPKKGGS
jgi:hypothetical protein